jgi:hypothetical protein
LARIAVDETPVPSSAGTWLEKKKRNSNTPRGVCRYFPVVTRDIVDSCISMASATSFRIIGCMDSSPRSRKVLLALDDGARDSQHGVVADLEAAQQPARLLQLRAQHRVVRRARNHAGVALVHPDARQGGGV